MTDVTFETEIIIDEKALRRFMEGREVATGLLILGQIGETSAKGHAPVDTATLQRSITHELGRRGFNQFVRIGTNIFYAIFQELGTRFHPAHPYLRPALAEIEAYLRGGGNLQ